MLFLSSFEACLYVAGLHFELPFVLGRIRIFAGKVNRLPSAGSFVFFVEVYFFWVSKATGSFWIRSGTKRPLTSLRRVVDASRFRQRERRVYSVNAVGREADRRSIFRGNYVSETRLMFLCSRRVVRS